MPRIFITGATGLVGSHAALLWRERGWRARALVRSHSDISALEEIGCEFVIGDVTRPETFRGAAEDCEVVLHAAAVVFGRGGWEAHRRVNVDGTRYVLDEALRSEAPRFIHLSSVAVYGSPSRHAERPITEEAATDLALPAGAHYARSKQMAERVVRQIPPGRLAWTILRPCVVMGERDRKFTPRVLAAARLPALPMVGPGTNDLPIVYAGNVALAAWTAARDDRAAGGIYNVTDDGVLTQRELFALAGSAGTDAEGMAERGGPLLIPVPGRVARGVAAVASTARSIFPFSGHLPLPDRVVEFLGDRDPYADDRLRSDLGWEPTVSTREGWARSVRWAAGA